VQQIFIGADGSVVDEIESLAARNGVPLLHASSRVIDALSDTATPQDAVAVVDVPRRGLDDIPSASSLLLLLAEVRDPGNAGTLVRSAVAGGADAVVFGAGSVDAFGPKAVRAAAGALFRTVVVTDVDLVGCSHLLRTRGLVILAADAAGDPADEVDLTRPLALVVGNEARGLDARLAALPDARVSIPMPGPMESLNAGVAGSVLLFEAVRQRRARRARS
jgi:TrmH family RNA methyltransferase